MNNKYGLVFSNEEMKQEILRLTNQLWKMIPMWENGEDCSLKSSPSSQKISLSMSRMSMSHLPHGKSNG